MPLFRDDDTGYLAWVQERRTDSSSMPNGARRLGI